MPVPLTRRMLMLGTVAAISGSLLPHSTVAVAAKNYTGRRNAVRCLLDSSIDQFSEIRGAAGAAGMVVISFERDVGILAMQIDARWRTSRAPLFGVTRPSSFFILEQMARRNDMVPAFIVEHRRDRQGQWRHEGDAPVDTLIHGNNALPGANWRNRICNFLLEASLDLAAYRARSSVRGVGSFDEVGCDPLRFMSWSIVANG